MSVFPPHRLDYPPRDSLPRVIARAKRRRLPPGHRRAKFHRRLYVSAA
jgi:hypothetical protein